MILVNQPLHLNIKGVLLLLVTSVSKVTVLAASFDPPFLDWTTLWGCLSKMADLAVGWVRKGGPIY